MSPWNHPISYVQLLILAIGLSAYPVVAQTVDSRAGDVEPSENYTTDLTMILDSVVTDEGLVRYELLRGPLNGRFRRVLKTIEEYEADNLEGQAEKLAFWLNAYNVQMLQHIFEHPEITRVIEDDYDEEFFHTRYRTAQTPVTLDQIEHVILRGQEGPNPIERFRLEQLDPRIHVGLNCAALSCPPLRRQAFTADSVEEELNRALREFTADSRHFRLEHDTLVASAILDWFGEDFERTGEPAGDYLLEYMPAGRPDYQQLRSFLEGKSAEGLRRSPDIRFEYDWTVNAARLAER
jgi:hypothetical protein